MKIEDVVVEMGGRVMVDVGRERPRGWLVVDEAGGFVGVSLREDGELRIRRGNLGEKDEGGGMKDELGPELVVNGDFAAGDEGWVFYTDGKGSAKVVSGEMWVELRSRGQNVQLYQAGIVLEPGARYVLALEGSATRGEPLGVMVHQHDAPYANYGLNRVVEMGPEGGRWELEFRAPAWVEDGPARLRLWMAPFGVAGTFYVISGVSLRKAL